MKFKGKYTSREIKIGKLFLGAFHPVRIQSMTSTNTMNIDDTVEQSIDLIESGCELVRIAVPSVKAVEKLEKISHRIRQAGFDTPLIADVHFNPKIAEIAASVVEKIRINPGNYVLQSNNERFNSDSDKEEIERISCNLSPLIKKCIDNDTAMRIGVNHGSLSKRILYKYGNTAEGMVKSAMEFARICRELNFDKLVLSLKSSNPKIMMAANKMLVSKLKEENLHYPLHLGVTEAGDAEDGRIKSAIGIGTLLKEGIGDTIRVSLTEDPVQEIPVARSIIEFSGVEKPRGRIFFTIPKSHDFKYPVIVSDSESDGADICFNPESAQKISEKDIHKIRNSSHNKLLLLKTLYHNVNYNDFIIKSSIDYAEFLFNETIDAVWLKTDSFIRDEVATRTAFDILQACGSRVSKAEYISCPGCSRTLYNITKTLEKIKKKTNHLKGLRIAVMGCIVNGPGEMADADYGYVGSGKGRINLFKSKTLVKKNIKEENAIDELINLIKENGEWVER